VGADTDPVDGDAIDDEEFGQIPADFEGEDPGTHNALPPKLEAWRRRSAAGAILTGFALGLQQALETKPNEPSIVIQTSGDPPTDLPVEAEFEYRRPRNTVVNVRPWLLESNRSGDTEPDPGEEDES
jgi:hypothetical protein